jgi:hypothetical protein
VSLSGLETVLHVTTGWNAKEFKIGNGKLARLHEYNENRHGHLRKHAYILSLALCSEGNSAWTGLTVQRPYLAPGYAMFLGAHVWLDQRCVSSTYYFLPLQPTSEVIVGIGLLTLVFQFLWYTYTSQ